MRQFVSNSEFDKNGFLEICGKDFKYFRNVLRFSAGDMVNVRLPSGKIVSSTLCKIDEKKRKITLQICGIQTDAIVSSGNVDFIPPVEFWLFQFAAKGQKMDLIVRQATECGVSKIVPVAGEFCQKGTEEKNLKSERFVRIVKEARQQSGSPVNTEILSTVSVKEACDLWKEMSSDGKSAGFVLYERTEFTENIFSVIKKFNEIKKCFIVCGAEGGISSSEIEMFRAAGFIPIHFKTNILRCESAALYGIACLQNALMEKDFWLEEKR